MSDAIAPVFVTIHRYYYLSRMLIKLNGLAIAYLLHLLPVTPTPYFLASRPHRNHRQRPLLKEYHALKASQVVEGVMLRPVKG